MGSPQEGHHLSTRHGHIGTKGGGAGAIGHTVLHSPQHGVIVVVAGAHINERIARLNDDLLERNLDFHTTSGHLEGELAIALVGQVQLVALAVGDNQLVQLVAVIGGDGDGDRLALLGITLLDRNLTAGDLARQGDRVGGIAGAATAAGGRIIGGHSNRTALGSQCSTIQLHCNSDCCRTIGYASYSNGTVIARQRGSGSTITAGNLKSCARRNCAGHSQSSGVSSVNRGSCRDRQGILQFTATTIGRNKVTNRAILILVGIFILLGVDQGRFVITRNTCKYGFVKNRRISNLRNQFSLTIGLDAAKEVLTERSNRRGNVNRSQLRIVVNIVTTTIILSQIKCIVANGGNTIRKDDLFQRKAARKCHLRNFGYARRNHSFCK